MSQKKPLQLWKKDSPEPKDYNYHADPLHRMDPNSGCSDLMQLTRDLTSVLKNWMENPKIAFDTITQALKKDWFKKGGSVSNYDSALEQAFLKSGYYKNFK